MTWARILGWYLLLVCIALLSFSLRKLAANAGNVDLSFLILLPFAIGLIASRRWARTATPLLGVAVATLVVAISVVHSFGLLRGLEVGFGPFFLLEPSAPTMWAFALAVLFLLCLPMVALLHPTACRRGHQ